jgi:hypothetical protein
MVVWSRGCYIVFCGRNARRRDGRRWLNDLSSSNSVSFRPAFVFWLSRGCPGPLMSAAAFSKHRSGCLMTVGNAIIFPRFPSSEVSRRLSLDLRCRPQIQN